MDEETTSQWRGSSAAKCVFSEVLLHHDGRKKERARLLTSPINKASQYQEEYCLYKLSDVVVSVVLWCISCL